MLENDFVPIFNWKAIKSFQSFFLLPLLLLLLLLLLASVSLSLYLF